MSIKGRVYHHHRLISTDGWIGKKYIVLLNDPQENEPYLFLKTTSKKKNKPETPGCISWGHVFFIKAQTDFFLLNTWVQLYDIFEFSKAEMIQNGIQKDLTIEGCLKDKIISGIIDCLLDVYGDDVSSYHRKLIRPPILDAMQKLKDKFNKR